MLWVAEQVVRFDPVIERVDQSLDSGFSSGAFQQSWYITWLGRQVALPTGSRVLVC